MRSFVYWLSPLFFMVGILPASAQQTAKDQTIFQSPPVSQIAVTDVGYSENAPGKFIVSGTVQNPTSEPREVVVRGLLSIFDQTVPKGDMPLFVLRKDTTLILLPGQSQAVEIPLINEGSTPRGALRMEPVIRVRRQRIWNY